jgi:hypothetical protein
MLKGRFGNPSGRPYIEARLAFPRLGISANISFLVDTGADCAVIMPGDGVRMSLDYSELQNVADSVGIGGLSRDFSEDALMAFTDDMNIYAYILPIRVSTPIPDIMTIPSLLGRDIIRRREAIFDHTNARFEINVRSADWTVPVPARPATAQPPSST